MISVEGVRAWEAHGLSDLLTAAADAYGNTPVLRYGDRSISYEELAADVGALTRGLWRCGISPGDRVGIILEDVPEAVTSIVAASVLGCPPIVLSVRNTPHELETLLNAGGASAVITQTASSNGNLVERYAPVFTKGDDGEFDVPTLRLLVGVSEGGLDEYRGDLAGVDIVHYDDIATDTDDSDLTEAVEDAVSAVRPGDTAVVLFTSGTTSAPKAVIRTHRNLIPHAVDAAEWYEISEGDVLLNAYPIASAAGILRFLMAVAAGGTCLLQDHYTLESTMEFLVDGEVNYISGPDTIYKDLLEHPRSSEVDTESLDRVFVSMGGGLDVEFGETVEEAFETPIENAYGLTEANPLALRTRRDQPFDARVRPGGQTGYGTEVRLDGVGEQGEICLRGISVTPGYENNEAANEAAFDDDGWFHTNDAGYEETIDGEAFCFFANRSDAMFQVGSFNVSPVEIEVCLRDHPSVGWAGAAGIEHDRLGAVPAALVTTTAKVSPEAITEFCSSRLSNQKVPRTVFIIDESEIPYKVGHHGRKIDRDKLADVLAAKTGSSAE